MRIKKIDTTELVVQRITTLEALRDAALDKRAVIAPGSGVMVRGAWAVRPAAFVMNYTGSQLLGLFERGLYVYDKRIPYSWYEGERGCPTVTPFWK